MSVQFGRWHFGGLAAEPDYLDQAAKMLAPRALDGETRYCSPGVDIIYGAFHTTGESRREQQPRSLCSGAVLTWDGRLDNREELLGQLTTSITPNSPDVAIVAKAYEQWETKAFAKLIGDWALSIWEPRERVLILAKDFLGARHLYYTSNPEQVTWSTILDPLVLLAGKTFELQEEYIAGWLAFFPASHLTPYVGIHAVPPSTFVLLRPGQTRVTKYWDFDAGKQTLYSHDQEYEQHFRAIFRESVRKRLRADAPVLAELSGGMDSSSIVCMAHSITMSGPDGAPRLDTLSYYNDSEPNWNERPYFSRVEEKLGQTGCHIDVSREDSLELQPQSDEFPAEPSSCARSARISSLFAACLEKQRNRVVLSGVGGDEVTGGVPTPVPELMDWLARMQFRRLAGQLKAWALYERKPWIHLLLETLRGFFPPSLVGVAEPLRPPSWLFPRFASRYRHALSCYPLRVKVSGALPSFQENVSTLEVLRRQLACLAVPSHPPHEKRFPYLDRDLLEFLYSVPRDQLVRPGQRRSLMRRALKGIVCDEVLNRRRKAYATRSPVANALTHWNLLIQARPKLLSAALGIIDEQAFGKCMEDARLGQQVRIVAMMRALTIENWLRRVADRLQISKPRNSGISFSASKSSLVLVASTGASEVQERR